MVKYTNQLVSLAWGLCLWCVSGFALAIEWPQEIVVDGGTIVVYQPQPESLEGNTLSGRAAMSIEQDDGSAPIFGAFWMTATLDTDRSEDRASISNIRVTRVSWPDSKDTGEQRFTQVVESALAETVLNISLTALTASLAAAEKSQQSLENLKNDPPAIVFEEQLAVLLLYDGDPRFSPIENSQYERAMNTPLAVVSEASRKRYYLTSGSLWYAASDPLGPWAVTQNPPADLVAMIPEPDDAPPATVPAIISATQPTELVVTQGKPNWVSLEGGKLLYVENTETPWLRDLATGNMYLQLSGRWYRSRETSGPWTFVRSDKLPQAFQEIPPASTIGGVRTAVAGTPEADEAVADAQVPQTAAIKRSEARLTVEYDGKPKFEAIEGTAVAYAVNTGAQVLRIDNSYYAVDNGVWFTAKAAEGPWIVADTIPAEEIASIPPSSPVYNTTFVTVYDATPEVVYVGYTPGYLWSFPYYGVPVYGTGWYYPPYWGRYYYPRPPTWGFHVGYNPWTGWNFGVSWGGPFLSVGVSWGGGWGGAYRPWGCCGGWYGGGYRHNDIHINTGDINIGNNVNIGNRRNDVSLKNTARRDHNLYNKGDNRLRNADARVARADLKQARSNSQRENDLFADRNGQVARKQGDDWEVRKDNAWQKAEDRAPARDAKASAGQRDAVQHAKPMDRAPAPALDHSRMQQRPQIDRSRMNRELQGRQRGGGVRRR